MYKLSIEHSKILSCCGDVVLILHASTCNIALRITYSRGNLKRFLCLAFWFLSTLVICRISVSKIIYDGHLFCLLKAFYKVLNKSGWTIDKSGVCLMMQLTISHLHPTNSHSKNKCLIPLDHSKKGRCPLLPPHTTPRTLVKYLTFC